MTAATVTPANHHDLMAQQQSRLEPPRDRWGRPILPPRAGGEPRPWTRVTTLAATLDDRAALERWKLRQLLVGAVERADLVQLAATVDRTDRTGLDSIVDRMLDAAKSDAAATRGTAIHAAVEHWARTGQIMAGFDAEVGAVAAELERIGATVDRERVEQLVVNEDVEAAGTFDLRLNIGGRWHVADLKTGSTVDRSAHSFAVQLAVYASHTSVFDVRAGAHTDPVELDQDRGLIIHCPAGASTATAHWVDLKAGREALEHAVWVRGWRRRRDLISAVSDRDATVIRPTVDPPDQLAGADEPPPAGAVDALMAEAAAAPDTAKQAAARWRRQAKGRLAWSIVDQGKTRRTVAINRTALRLAVATVQLLGDRRAHTDDEIDDSAAQLLAGCGVEMGATIGETLAVLTPEACKHVYSTLG